MSRNAAGRLVASAIASGVVALALPRLAGADPAPAQAETASSWTASRSLLQHFGVEAARHLLGGGDAPDSATPHQEVIRGIDRAVGLGSPEGVALLVHVLSDPHGPARSDARVLLAMTRALAPSAGKDVVARALAEFVLNAGSPQAQVRPTSPDAPPAVYDVDREARIQLARETAALALADTRDELATDLLTLAARRAGPGQLAAAGALATAPPVVDPAPPLPTPTTSLLSATLGDLRARDALVESTRSLDGAARIAALRAAAALGDTRAIAVAEDAVADADPSARVAAARALVDLAAPGAATAVRHLVEDDKTAERGIELAARIASEEVVGALAARIRASSDTNQRRAATLALAHASDARALEVLVPLLADRVLTGEASEAVARSAAPGAWDAILAALRSPPTHRSGVRMAAIRGRTHGHVPDPVRHALRDLSRAADASDRAAALAALVLLGETPPRTGLGDPDVRVRRAVAMACEPTDPGAAAELLAHLATERDPVTRLLLTRGLAVASATGGTTTEWVDHVLASDVDAPMAVLALARRGDEKDREVVLRSLDSRDPLLRAHAARGLAETKEPSAVSLLSAAYEAEVDPAVRRVLTLSLAARTEDSPLRARALEGAARFDPDPSVRAIAARARAGLPPPVLPARRDSALFHLVTDTGASPPAALGVIVRADGLAVPVAFDEDGYALIPAPRGPSRLALAPRLSAYEAGSHGD